jgi:hypothetical protein
VQPVQTINLTRVDAKPLRAWPNIEQPKKVLPENLVLNIDDLSEDYKICHNGTDEPGRIVEPIDSFSRSFSTANCSDFEDSLLSVIIIFSSSFDASIFYHETKVPVVVYEESKIFNSSVDAIGDNSFAHELEISNSTQIYYWFRYSNIVGLLKVPYEYSFAQTLAEIIEQKIYDSV